MKIGALVTYKEKPYMVLYVNRKGYSEIREYHEEIGPIGSFCGFVEKVHLSELTTAGMNN
jgi:hypothetical protein